MPHGPYENISSRVRRMEEKCSHHSGHSSDKSRKRNAEYIGNIVVSIIFYYIVNHLQEWNVGFLRDNFQVVLWMINLNIFLQIGGNALVLVTGDQRTIRYFSRTLMEAGSFVVQLMLFYIYPFDFSHAGSFAWIDTVLPILLIIGMVVSAVKALSNLWKLFFRPGPSD